MNVRRIAPALSAAVLGVLCALVVALPSAAKAPARPGKLTVGVRVVHFKTDGRRLRATGFVTARLTDNGRTHTVRTRVAVTAASGRKCTVLYLYLNQLNLQLLGLTAHLDKVQLSLTGNPNGGVLGSLFCKLARAKVSTARASALHRINRQWANERQDVVRFSAAVTPRSTTSTATNASCQVLSLIVGPLNLQLLGLEVNLNKVTLKVTATRGQGALGDLFCTLADNNSSGGTTSTQTTTTQTTTSTTTTTTPTTTTGTTT